MSVAAAAGTNTLGGIGEWQSGRLPREVLIERRLVVDDRNILGDQICAILRQSKYLRDRRTGRTEGFGKELLP